MKFFWRRDKDSVQKSVQTIAIRSESIAKKYIAGNGIEICALHKPLKVPESAKVKYVDRMSTSSLRKQYPELNSEILVEVDIIDDGEQLGKICDLTQDFVIASHFLDHCQNPIKAIINMLRVCREGGILYLIIPDKRYTFDINRPVTSIKHIVRDYSEGPEWSRMRMQHFKEWVELVEHYKGAEVRSRVIGLLNMDYSIHYHVWTPIDMIELIVHLKNKQQLPFEVELIYNNAEIKEVIIILRKAEGAIS